MNGIIRPAAVAAVLLACVACGASDPSASTGASTTSSSQAQGADPVYSRTVVRRDANGKEQVVQTQITASEQRAELAAAKARNEAAAKGTLSVENLTFDGRSNCQGSDIWLFDQTNDKGNEICFYDSSSSQDYADLSQYLANPGCTGCIAEYWWSYKYGSAVQSYYSGNQEGCFDNTSSGNTPSYCNFGTYVDVTNAPSQSCWSASTFQYLLLNAVCTYIP